MSEESRPEELELKTSPIELKEDGEKRYMEAVFSLYDEIDSDNDITLMKQLKLWKICNNSLTASKY